MSKNQNQLLHGPILYALLTFAIPIMISTLFQQFYNAADMTIVGNYLGQQALAAVGATGPVYELIVGFALGIGAGMSIVSARYFGAQNIPMIKKTTAHALIIGFGISICVMFIGHFGLKTLLTLLNTPDDILNVAFNYIYVITIFTLFTFLYNLGAGLLRAIGNSVVPLLILVMTSLLNVVLDIFFITTLQMGIAGAAYATIISQAISAIVCFIYIVKKAPILVPSQSDFKLDKPLLKELLAQGLSMGFMSSIVSIGSVILQTAVNQFGSTVIAAQITARRVQFFFIIPITSIGNAMSTFVSQNFGANQFLRIRKAIKIVFILSMVWGAFVAIFMHFFSTYFITFLSGSKEVIFIETARQYIAIATPLFGILGILFCLRNTLQGLGRKIEPLISSIIELIGKILFVYLIVPKLGYFGVMITEPIIWLFMTAQLAYSFYNNENIKQYR